MIPLKVVEKKHVGAEKRKRIKPITKNAEETPEKNITHEEKDNNIINLILLY
jgi:hypothetical protein